MHYCFGLCLNRGHMTLPHQHHPWLHHNIYKSVHFYRAEQNKFYDLFSYLLVYHYFACTTLLPSCLCPPGFVSLPVSWPSQCLPSPSSSQSADRRLNGMSLQSNLFQGHDMLETFLQMYLCLSQVLIFSDLKFLRASTGFYFPSCFLHTSFSCLP